MKTKALGIFVVIFLTTIITSCVSVKITTDYDKSIDFSKYKTLEFYGWNKDSDKILNDLDKKRIEEAFANEFERRGIKLVKSDGDMLASLFVTIKKKTQTVATTDNFGGYYGGFWGYGPGWGWGPTYSTTTYNTYDYLEGTLVCDLFDKSNKQLIWEGIATKTVDQDPTTRDKNIPIAVERLMRYYPVPPLKVKK